MRREVGNGVRWLLLCRRCSGLLLLLLLLLSDLSGLLQHEVYRHQRATARVLPQQQRGKPIDIQQQER